MFRLNMHIIIIIAFITFFLCISFVYSVSLYFYSGCSIQDRLMNVHIFCLHFFLIFDARVAVVGDS